MKIVYLNTHHAMFEKKLLGFLLAESKSTDIFCLQEADPPFFNKLILHFKNFNGYINKKKLTSGGHYSNVVFVRNDFEANSQKSILKGDMKVGLINRHKVTISAKEIGISNIHGVSQPGDKKDNSDRVRQTEGILNSGLDPNLPHIIGGDFNLLPDTKSIQLFERAGFRNLIKDFHIKTTRSRYAWKRALDNNIRFGIPIYEKQKFADYVFVSPHIIVKSFTVPNMNISDHLPLILEFDI